MAQNTPYSDAYAAGALTSIEGPELQRILEQHLRWTESGGTQGFRANLRDTDLSYYDLRGVVLAGANLRGADLTGSNLAGADLHGADLSEAILAQANLQKAVLFGANFTGAKMRAADLSGVEMSAANCTGASMQETNFEGATLDGCNMRDAALTSANLRGVNAGGATFHGANLESALFADADLSGADLRATLCRHAGFDRARLEQAQFKDAVLEGVDFTLADFLQAGEIDEEYRQLSLQAERWRMDQEKARLEQARAELEAARQKLMQKKMVIADWKRGENEFIVQSAVHAVWMKYLAIAWTVVAGLFACATLYQAAQIPMENLRLRELVVVLSVLGGITALFAVTARRTYKLARMMQHYGGFFRQKLGGLMAIQAGVPTLDQPPQAMEARASLPGAGIVSNGRQ